MKKLAAAVFILTAGAAQAITFGNATKPDPFAPGKSCETPEIMSIGSYVYSWPSKYDLIFSPQDYSAWIWRCEASGYISFPFDFDKISDAEHKRIATFLSASKYEVKPSQNEISPELLAHLESIYALRDTDDNFRAWFMRYLAWQNRQRPVADEYRKKAYDIHLKLLEGGKLEGFNLMDTHYILGFYSYKFGRAKEARDYFDRISTIETIDPETKKKVRGSIYLEGLARDVLEGKADDNVRFSNRAK